MKEKNEFSIGNQKFSSKASCAKYIRTILHKPRMDSALNNEEFCFMLEVLKKHPRADYKIKQGIKSIFVKKTKYGKLGFYALRNNGSKTDFSYLQCLSPSSKLLKTKIACRKAIRPSILEFKDKFFSVNKVVRNNHIIHHEKPSFDQIFIDWIKEKSINIEKIELGGFVDNCETVYFLDKEVEKSFVEFHNKHAELKVLSTEQHAKRHRGVNND